MHKKNSQSDNHNRLTQEETNKLVAAYAQSRMHMKQENGLPKYTEEMVNGWSFKLRQALRSIDEQSVANLINTFESNIDACVDMLADIANGEYTPKRWANSQRRYLGVSNNAFRG
jgi:hypothetical protein